MKKKKRLSRYRIWRGGQIVSTHRTLAAAERAFAKECYWGTPSQLYDSKTGKAIGRCSGG
jgi:hypothetical protein